MFSRRQLLLGIGALSLEAMMASSNSAECLQDAAAKDSILQFNAALLSIMRAQEQLVNIKYKEAPKIKFEIPSDVHAMQMHIFEGKYHKDTKTMYVHPSYKRCDLSPIIAEPFRNDFKIIEDGWNQRENDLNFVKELLAHEVGHHYVHELYSELNIPDILTPDVPRLTAQEHLGVLIIREGIGTYFGEMMKGDKALKAPTTDAFEKHWMRKYELAEIKSGWGDKFIIYEGGYGVVKPIIDKHKKKGIEYLLKTPLVIKNFDVSVVIDYQKNALNALKE